MERRILTQVAMCKLSNTTIGLMCLYLNAKKTPSLTTAKRIAEDCNVPIEIFLEKSVQEHFLGKSFLKEDVDVYIRKKSKWDKKIGDNDA